jgi:hypothetical protein
MSSEASAEIEHPSEGYWAIGVPTQINGLSGWWMKTNKRYVYKEHGATCPVCGKCGWPWAGWFSCEFCPTVAFMPTGEVLSRAVPMEPTDAPD